MSAPKIDHYAPAPYGDARPARFYVTGLEVQVRPWASSSQEDVDALARALADVAAFRAEAGSRIARLIDERDAARAERDAARAERDIARAQIPPARLAELNRGGVVRMDSRGVWLLNRREGGWSAFGFLLRDWDELFRRFNVRVGEVGSDEHGPYWTVEPIGAAS